MRRSSMPPRRAPMRRMPITATAGGMRRTKINPVSARRRARDAGYPAARRAVYERADGTCAAVTDGCLGAGTQVHHIAGRGGPDPHRLDNLQLVCPPCHEHIHANPAEAFAAGWMRSRIGDQP